MQAPIPIDKSGEGIVVVHVVVRVVGISLEEGLAHQASARPMGTAQALAVNKGEPLSMRHIREVLNVQQNFEQDLKGGTGYQDAMRSYF